MRLLSKDSSLEESLSKMKASLKRVGCQTKLSTQKHPLSNCFSVNLASTLLPNHIYSNGKGVVSQASLASAYGEYIERLQTNNFFADFYLPHREFYPDEKAFSFGGEYLNAELIELYSAGGTLCEEDLIDFNSDYRDKIVSLPFIKQSDNSKLYFPLNILNNLYVSNGLATGNSAQEAQVQALSEIFERYAKMQIIKNGYALPSFPKEVLERLSRVSQDIEELRLDGYIVELLDASLGGRFPVVAISFINPKTSTLFVSFGAHPILEVAVERTMTELMQGRSLENLDSFEMATFDMSLVADSFNLEAHFIDSNGKLGFSFLAKRKSFAYTPFSYSGSSTQEELIYLQSILKREAKESYIREYEYLGFYSCQIIVPQLSEVYPMEDLIYNNKNRGKLIRDMVLNSQNYQPEDILIEIEQLEETLDIEKYIGVIFTENFTLREFKAELLISMDEMQEALELLEYTQSRVGYLVVELARMQELELDFDEYKEGLYSLYSQSRVQRAQRILDGEAALCDRSLHPEYLSMLELYDRLAVAKNA